MVIMCFLWSRDTVNFTGAVLKIRCLQKRLDLGQTVFYIIWHSTNQTKPNQTPNLWSRYYYQTIKYTLQIKKLRYGERKWSSAWSWQSAVLDFKPRQSGFHASEAGKPQAGLPKTSTWQTYLVPFRERQMFCLCEDSLFSSCASNLSAWTMRDVSEAGLWRGLEALSTFSTPGTRWHPAPCHPDRLSCVPEASVCLGWREGGGERCFRSETMCHTTDGFFC